MRHPGLLPYPVLLTILTLGLVLLPNPPLPAAPGGYVQTATFTPAAPSITIIYPNGGEPHVAGTNDAIRWTSTEVLGNVKIEYSNNGGGTWIPIYPSTENDGFAVWTVQGPPTLQARVRVSSINNPAVADTSNANFVINPPVIQVRYPNGGEPHVAGTNDVILWNGADLSGNVKIEYSNNNGVTWIPIYHSTLSDGEAPWTVQKPATTQARVRITSLTNPANFDTSDTTFPIQASPPTVYRASSRGAAGFSLGGVTIFKDGSAIYSKAGGGGGGRGWTMAAISPATGALLAPITTYDTWQNLTALAQLTADIRALPPGTILMLAVGDEAGLTLAHTCELKNDSRVHDFVALLESLGATKMRQHCHWGSHALALVIGGRLLDESYVNGAEVAATVGLPL
jgi:interleukin-like EMT inducer protein